MYCTYVDAGGARMHIAQKMHKGTAASIHVLYSINKLGHYGESNKFRVYLIIRTFGLLLLRITTKLQECTEITTFPAPPSGRSECSRNGAILGMKSHKCRL